MDWLRKGDKSASTPINPIIRMLHAQKLSVETSTENLLWSNITSILWSLLLKIHIIYIVPFFHDCPAFSLSANGTEQTRHKTRKSFSGPIAQNKNARTEVMTSIHKLHTLHTRNINTTHSWKLNTDHNKTQDETKGDASNEIILLNIVNNQEKGKGVWGWDSTTK